MKNNESSTERTTKTSRGWCIIVGKLETGREAGPSRGPTHSLGMMLRSTQWAARVDYRKAPHRSRARLGRRRVGQPGGVFRYVEGPAPRGYLSRILAIALFSLHLPPRISCPEYPRQVYSSMPRAVKKAVEEIVSPSSHKTAQPSFLNDMPLTPPQSPPPNERSLEPSDLHIPDNYVQHTLTTVPPLPPVQWKDFASELEWISVLALTLPPALSIYALAYVPIGWKTAAFAVFWYFVTGYVSRFYCPSQIRMEH